MTLDLALEIAATATGLVFLFLLIRERISCWAFGIVSAALSVVLLYRFQLYSESLLYLFYVAVGIYGWITWRNAKRNDRNLPIQRWAHWKHLVALGIGILGAIGLGAFFQRYTDADRPWLDATTTSFSFVASFLEAHKVLGGWLYWTVINAVTVYLYLWKGLHIYAGLYVVYFAFSVAGWFIWKKSMQRAD